jgi:hypothetical protein
MSGDGSNGLGSVGMGDAERQSVAVRLTVTNRSSVRRTLVLEPAGEIYMLEPGETRTLAYAGDPEPRLSIDLGEGETKIREEGPGRLTLG